MFFFRSYFPIINLVPLKYRSHRSSYQTTGTQLGSLNTSVFLLFWRELPSNVSPELMLMLLTCRSSPSARRRGGSLISGDIFRTEHRAAAGTNRPLIRSRWISSSLISAQEDERRIMTHVCPAPSPHTKLHYKSSSNCLAHRHVHTLLSINLSFLNIVALIHQAALYYQNIWLHLLVLPQLTVSQMLNAA